MSENSKQVETEIRHAATKRGRDLRLGKNRFAVANQANGGRMHKTDEFARARSRLTALKQNIPPEYGYVQEDCVNEYTTVLDALTRLRCDVEEFRIPDQWMETYTWQVPDGEGYETRHSDTRQVIREKYLMKLDSVLNYLSSLASSKSQGPIGFT
jgi:hypothetical protein